jgi:septum site-determining protein MinC
MTGIAVLDVLSNDINQLVIQLQQRLQLAPELFKQAPVALHVPAAAQPLDIAALCSALKPLALIPVAITATSDNAAQLAQQAQLGVLDIDSQKSSPTTPAAAVTAPATKVVKQPVRSGQQIVCDGDLIVLGQVGAGAEVIAAGNIHIYGALRGRAFAGAKGDESCHIFCRQLDAELVAIAGVFKVSEELDDTLRQQPSHIQLQADQLQIAALG